MDSSPSDDGDPTSKGYFPKRNIARIKPCISSATPSHTQYYIVNRDIQSGLYEIRPKLASPDSPTIRVSVASILNYISPAALEVFENDLFQMEHEGLEAQETLQAQKKKLGRPKNVAHSGLTAAAAMAVTEPTSGEDSSAASRSERATSDDVHALEDEDITIKPARLIIPIHSQPERPFDRAVSQRTDTSSAADSARSLRKRTGPEPVYAPPKRHRSRATSSSNSTSSKSKSRSIPPKQHAPARSTRAKSETVDQDEEQYDAEYMIAKKAGKQRLAEHTPAPESVPETEPQSEPEAEAEPSNGEEDWEVEYIMGHVEMDDGVQYLVKWSGYPEEDGTYVPDTDMEGAQDLIAAYMTSKASGS